MKPPKRLYMNPSGTNTEVGYGFVGFSREDMALADILQDTEAGIVGMNRIWIYELKEVRRVVVGLEAGKL